MKKEEKALELPALEKKDETLAVPVDAAGPNPEHKKLGLCNELTKFGDGKCDCILVDIPSPGQTIGAVTLRKADPAKGIPAMRKTLNFGGRMRLPIHVVQSIAGSLGAYLANERKITYGSVEVPETLKLTLD